MHQHGDDRRELQRDGLALLAALCLHALGVVALVYWPHPPNTGPRVGARSISAQQFAANRRTLTPEQAARRAELKKALAEKKDEAEKKKIEEQLKGQIVDLPATADNSAPKDAKYLSEFNTNTKKETKSKFRTPDYKRATNEVSTAAKNAVAEQSSPAAGKGGAPGEKQEKKAGKEAVNETPKVSKRDRLELALDPNLGMLRNQNASEELQGNSTRYKQEDGEAAQAEQGGGGVGVPQQIKLPNMGVLAKLSGAPANDFLPDDVQDGAGTFLNSREFKFAPFFNRLKQTVSEHWKPLDELKRRDPSMNIYGGQARVTVVDVVLAEDGSLKSVSIEKSCGVDFLDKEAVAAFQRAQPFPNPPKQLVKNGEVSFPFGFHVSFDSRFF